MKYVSKSRSVIIGLAILIAISTIVIFAATQQQSEFRQISKDIRVENKTNSLIVESLTEIRKRQNILTKADSANLRTFEITLKNNSKKPIVNFSLLLMDAQSNERTTQGVERGGMTDDWSLLPNETDVNRFSAASKGEIVLVIAAVLFDDGTEEGNPDEILRLRNIRTGIKLAYEQIVPILQQSLNESELTNSSLAIQSIEKEISSISDEKILGHQKAGFLQAKNFILSGFVDIRNNLKSKSVYSSESEMKNIYNSEIAERLATIQRTIARF